MKEENQKGITLIALVVTIIVLLIIAAIGISGGKDKIRRANLESLKTNMMLIEAKARECVEEANFKLGPNAKEIEKIEEIRQSVYENENDKSAKLEKLADLESEFEEQGINIPSEITSSENEILYCVTEEALEKWGLNKIEVEPGEVYLIKFNEVEATVEVYNNIGFNNKYSLTDISDIEL